MEEVLYSGHMGWKPCVCRASIPETEGMLLKGECQREAVSEKTYTAGNSVGNDARPLHEHECSMLFTIFHTLGRGI